MSDSELAMAHGAARQGTMLQQSPYSMQSKKKLAMWPFVADAVTFSVALIAYGYLRVPLRFLSPRTISVLVLLCATVPSAPAQKSYKDPHRKQTVGFSADLDTPPDKVVEIVKSVATDTIIRGTSMYAKDPDIDQAEFAKTSAVLAPAPPPAQVFYKVKSKVLSPEHFPSASDMGTITVRYTVEAISPERTRVGIDAVFVTDAGRHLYASDGSVETAEYAEIIIQIKALEAPQVRHHSLPAPTNTGQETIGLQNTLADEQTRLADAQREEKKLQEKVKQLQFNTEGRICSQTVPLKASPYDHSTTVMSLEKGLTVTVLTTTKYWYRVRTAKGDEGWIYYAFLEPLT